MRLSATIVALGLTLLPSVAFAQVHVRGYTRSDGTYVRPHIRSAPDNSLANNYGASRSSPLYSPYLPDLSVVTPSTRDHDRDGVANMHDRDDDNDGLADNYDLSQYGTVGQYQSNMRSMLLQMYNQNLERAHADGVITPHERSNLDFWRQMYDGFR